MMRKRFRFKTRVGYFYLAEQEGRVHVVFDEVSLGSYANAALALDDLVGGHTFSPGAGIDTAELGIADELSEWEPVERDD
jgi:hypothetical protein